MVPRPPSAVRPCCWQASWPRMMKRGRSVEARETVGGKSTLDADWALHLRSFPPAYNGLNKNRAISILACSDGLYYSLYVFRGHYVLADLCCIRCTEQTETSFFWLEAAVHYIKTLGVTFFLSGSLGPPASASIWHLTVLHSDCFVDVSRQLSWVNWLLKREHNVRSRAVALRV